MAKNISASVHQKLLTRAKDSDRPFNELLQYFAMERFLYRLSQSRHVGQFVLKGALLFRIWDAEDSRATRDIDFLAYAENSLDAISKIIIDVLLQEVPPDGFAFDEDSVNATRIKEDADYEGVRIVFDGYLGKARVRMQLDVGFGDVINPDAYESEYPTLLDHQAPVLRIYPPETVIAEKLEAMLHLGSLNSRMKDFFDVWQLSKKSFDGAILLKAIRETFENRNTEIAAFSELNVELVESLDRQVQWTAFLKKSMLVAPADFGSVLTEISDFLAPLLDAIMDETEFDRVWEDGGPWRERHPDIL